MGEPIVIKMADFSVYPSGRDATDGDFNGAKFRDTLLVPAIRKAEETGQKIHVSLANVLSFGSSFLEEAFGGLVRKGIVKKAFLEQNLIVDPGKPAYERYKNVIFHYIKTARPD